MHTVNKVLVASKQTAGTLRVYDTKSDAQRSDRHIIPYRVEYQVAQDLAFIAANEEQASTEDRDGKGITIHVASNAGVKPCVRKTFGDISNILQQCAC